MIVLIGFIEVFICPLGPFILKLIPNNPSPTSLGIIISPINGILEIILFNVFADAAPPLLFYNLEEDLWPAIKSFLIFLKRVPEYPKSHVHGIPEDQTCTSELNSI